jgi:hypothetical protein
MVQNVLTITEKTERILSYNFMAEGLLIATKKQLVTLKSPCRIKVRKKKFALSQASIIIHPRLAPDIQHRKRAV